MLQVFPFGLARRGTWPFAAPSSPWQRAQHVNPSPADPRPLTPPASPMASRRYSSPVMSGRLRIAATTVQTSSSRLCATQPGMPAYLMPCLTIQNSCSPSRPQSFPEARGKREAFFR